MRTPNDNSILPRKIFPKSFSGFAEDRDSLRIGGTPVHGAGGPSSLMDVPTRHCDGPYILPWANLLFQSGEERGPVSHKRYSCNFSGRLPLAVPRQVRIRYKRGWRGSQHKGFEFCGGFPVALCRAPLVIEPAGILRSCWLVPSVSAVRPRAPLPLGEPARKPQSTGISTASERQGRNRQSTTMARTAGPIPAGGCLPRTSPGYGALTGQVMAICADIAAYQEVETTAAAWLVLPVPHWHVEMSSRPILDTAVRAGTVRRRALATWRQGSPFIGVWPIAATMI